MHAIARIAEIQYQIPFDVPHPFESMPLDQLGQKFDSCLTILINRMYEGTGRQRTAPHLAKIRTLYENLYKAVKAGKVSPDIASLKPGGRKRKVPEEAE